jgi:hypothetical protein
VRWALAGQLAALILLAAALAFGPARRFQPGAAMSAAPPAPAAPANRRPAEYVTLSAPAAASVASPAAPRPQIRLLFVETATEKQMRDVLVRTRGRLVDGPSPAGAYTLETAPAPPAPGASLTEAAPDSVGTILAYLRSQPIVRFAEPVAGTAAQAESPGWPGTPAGQAAAQGSQAPPRP